MIFLSMTPHPWSYSTLMLKHNYLSQNCQIHHDPNLQSTPNQKKKERFDTDFYNPNRSLLSKANSNQTNRSGKKSRKICEQDQIGSGKAKIKQKRRRNVLTAKNRNRLRQRNPQFRSHRSPLLHSLSAPFLHRFAFIKFN